MALWTPTQLASLQVWLDAADSATVSSSSGRVTQWSDKSGNGFHGVREPGWVSGGFNAPPVYGATTLDGVMPGLEFDTENRLDIVTHGAGSTNTVLHNQCTIFIVARYQTQGQTNWTGFVNALETSPASAPGFQIQGVEGSGTNIALAEPQNASTGSTSGLSWDNTTNPPTPAVVGLLSNGFVDSDNDISGTFWKNGTAGSLTTLDNVYGGTKPSWRGINLGYPGYDVGGRCVISEVIVCNAILSSDDREKIEGYLAHKWNLESFLPAPHPYKAAAPEVADGSNLTGVSATGAVGVVQVSAYAPWNDSYGRIFTGWGYARGQKRLADSGMLTRDQSTETTPTMFGNWLYTTSSPGYPVPVSGVSATGYVGDVVGTINASATITGVSATGSVGGSSADWTPASLDTAKKVGWFDAQDAATITHSSGALSAWGNKFGTTLMSDLTQSVGIWKPAYSATSYNSSFGGITFTNSNLEATIDGITDELTVIYILKSNGGHTNDGRLLSLRAPAGGGAGEDYLTSGAIIAINDQQDVFWYANAGGYGNPVAAGTSPAVLSVQFKSGASKLRWNGAEADAETFTFDFTPSNQFRIGASWHNTDENFKGLLAEVIVLRAATADDIQRVEAYAMHRRDLEGTLDAGHTYKAAPPTVTSSNLAVTAVDGTGGEDVTLTGVSATGYVGTADARPNLIVNPNNLLAANWGGYQGTASTSSVNLGDGTTMFRVQSTGGGIGTWHDTGGTPGTWKDLEDGATYTFECYVKSDGSSNYACIDVARQGISDWGQGFLLTGAGSLAGDTVGNGWTAAIALTNQTGIYRISVTGAVDSALYAFAATVTNNGQLFNGSVTGDGFYMSKPTLTRGSTNMLPLEITGGVEIVGVSATGAVGSVTVSAGVPWTPAELGSKLFAWYDPTDSSTLTTSGSDALTWAPKAGSGPTLVSAVSQYPTIDASSFGGKQSLLMGNSRAMWNLSTSLAGVVSVFQVLKTGADATGQGSVGRYFSATDGADLDFNNPDGTCWGPKTNGTIEWYRNNGEVFITGDVVMSTGTAILLDCIQDSTNGVMYQNGELFGTDTSTTALNATKFAFAIQAFNVSTGDNCGDTYYGDQVITVGVLTSDEIAKVQGYNAWKWGLEGSLPIDHPYKAAAPTSDGGTDDSVTLTGVSATGAVGTATARVDDEVTIVGVAAIGFTGTSPARVDDTLTLTGVSATGALGTLTYTVFDSVTLTGVSATGSVGSATARVDDTVTLTGVSATGSLGTLTYTVGDSATLTGVAATGAVGTLTMRVDDTVTLAGVSAIGFTGNSPARVDDTLTLTGVAATGAVGTTTYTVDDSVTLTGVSATGSLGTLAYTVFDTVTLTGVAATGFVGATTYELGVSTVLEAVSAAGAVGSVSFTGQTNASIAGVEATGAVGDLVIQRGGSVTIAGVSAIGFAAESPQRIDDSIILTGVSATGAVGTPTFQRGGSTTLTGVTATGAVGTATTRTDDSVTLTGVVASGAVGTPTFTVDDSVTLTGVFATGTAGTVVGSSGTVVLLEGNEAAASVGSVAVQVFDSTTTLGVAATGSVGNVTTRSDANVALMAVFGIGATGEIIGQVLVPDIETEIAGTYAKGRVGNTYVNTSYPDRVSILRGPGGEMLRDENGRILLLS